MGKSLFKYIYYILRDTFKALFLTLKFLLNAIIGLLKFFFFQKSFNKSKNTFDEKLPDSKYGLIPFSDFEIQIRLGRNYIYHILIIIPSFLIFGPILGFIVTFITEWFYFSELKKSGSIIKSIIRACIFYLVAGIVIILFYAIIYAIIGLIAEFS